MRGHNRSQGAPTLWALADELQSSDGSAKVNAEFKKLTVFFQFRGVLNAKVHAIRTHGPPEYYQCTFCGKVFVDSSILTTGWNESFLFRLINSRPMSLRFLKTPLLFLTNPISGWLGWRSLALRGLISNQSQAASSMFQVVRCSYNFRDHIMRAHGINGRRLVETYGKLVGEA